MIMHTYVPLGVHCLGDLLVSGDVNCGVLFIQ